MNYYPFHIGDYLSATRHLSWEEDAAFRRLLDTYYTTEKALPVEIRAVCRLVLATTESQREAVQQVLGEFFELTPDGWVNHRADAEIAEMQDRQHVAKAKANKRWDMHRAALSNANAMPQHKESNAAASKDDADAMLPTPTPTPTPTPIKNTKKTATVVATPDGVCDSVWADYLKTRKAKPTQTAIDEIKREADSAGWTMDEALRECCSRGWTGFKASWVADKATNQRPTNPESFKATDDRIARARWEEMTGRTHPESIASANGRVIDITPQYLEIAQ